MHNSLFEDELATFSVVEGHGLGTILHLQYGHSVDLTPPLYDVLAWLAERLGDSRELLRAPSLIAGVATVPLTYAVGLRTVGRPSALIGAALIALSPFGIYYSTQARPYALVAALALGSTLALLHAVETMRARWFALYGLLSCGAVYAHFTAVFVLLAQLAWAFFYFPRARPKLISANALAVAGFAPWLPAVIRDGRSPGARVFSVIEPLTPSAVAHDVAHWAVGSPWTTLLEVPGRLSLVLVITGLVVAATGYVARSDEMAPAPAPSSTGWRLPLALALAAPVGLVLYSLARESIWDVRNLISSSPGLALTAGYAVSAAGFRTRIASAALVVIALGLGALAMLRPADQRPDYGGAVTYVIDHGNPHDPVAVVQAPTPGPLSAVDAAFAYEGQKGRPLLRVGAAPLTAVLAAPPYAFLPSTPAKVLAAQAAGLPGTTHLWLIAPGSTPIGELEQNGPYVLSHSFGTAFGTGHLGQLMSTVLSPLSAFVRSITGFSWVQTLHYPGVLPLSLYEFRRT